MGFAGVVNSIKQLKRPIVVHFVQALGDVSISTANFSAIDQSSEGDFKVVSKPVPSFSGDRSVLYFRQLSFLNLCAERLLQNITLLILLKQRLLHLHMNL